MLTSDSLGIRSDWGGVRNRNYRYHLCNASNIDARNLPRWLVLQTSSRAPFCGDILIRCQRPFLRTPRFPHKCPSFAPLYAPCSRRSLLRILSDIFA
jgi:hypothetical protein